MILASCAHNHPECACIICKKGDAICCLDHKRKCGSPECDDQERKEL